MIQRYKHWVEFEIVTDGIYCHQDCWFFYHFIEDVEKFNCQAYITELKTENEKVLRCKDCLINNFKQTRNLKK